MIGSRIFGAMLVGVLATLAVPMTASALPAHSPSTIQITDTCDGSQVTITVGGVTGGTYKAGITAGLDDVWEKTGLDPGSTHTIDVPHSAGRFEAAVAHKWAQTWTPAASESHKWKRPAGCLVTSQVTFDPRCAGTEVTIVSGTFAESYVWDVAGETVEAEAGTVEKVWVPAGDDPIVVAGTAGGVAVPVTWEAYEWISPPCPVPHVEFEDTCDGAKALFANDASASADAEFAITVAGQPGLPLASMRPGHTPEPVLISGDSITVTEQVTGEVWQHDRARPDGCFTSVSGGGAGVDELPRTGTLWGPMAAIAVGLLVLGAAAVLLVRRRKVRFVAR